jgi:hypothetical protein
MEQVVDERTRVLAMNARAWAQSNKGKEAIRDAVSNAHKGAKRMRQAQESIVSSKRRFIF